MKIFVLLSRVPYPLEKGDKLRAYHQIKYLSKKHDIHLCCLNDVKLNDSAIEHLNPICKSIQIIPLFKYTIFINLLKSIFKGLPFQVGYFFSNKIKKAIHQSILNHNPDIIYCQLIRTSEYVKDISHIPKVLDYMDIFSKGIERRIQTSSAFFKPLLKIEHSRLLKYEKNIFNYFQAKTIISKQDRDQISHPGKNEIFVIPNGVDSDYFFPINKEKKYDLLFAGNMSYPPNIESALFLTNKILPLVHKINPSVNLLIAGANPSMKIRSLQSEKIKVSGWINDIRECYAQSKVFVAPMQISIGLQNKLLEAMAMKLPCIVSHLAYNALESPSNDFVMTATMPREYSENILMLLKNKERAEMLSSKGYEYVKKNYNWNKIIEQLNKIFISIKE